MRLKLVKKNVQEINMIPMIDVIMMLLIFFLVATQMKKQESDIDLTLPESEEALIDALNKVSPAPLLVNIPPNEAGHLPYVIGGLEMDGPGLARVLDAQARAQKMEGGEAASVNIRADGRAELSQLQNALMACQKAGIIKTFIAAERSRQ